MSPPTGTGDIALDPGRGMAWVDEHGPHLVDYASYHFEPARTVAAVTSALEACSVRLQPGNVADRAWLLSALRRECLADPSRREGFRPGPGPGIPDDRAVRRAWTLVDPLGAETLRLLYRHELPLRDLSYVLALPVREVGKLLTRTQDVVEILVSGLDGLARERPICPETAPLVATLFPEEPSKQTAAEYGSARVELLTHIVKCLVCKRPINIRYTVPQILSHPPISALTPEVRQRLLDSLPPAGALPLHRPPSSFGVPLAAPVDAGLTVRPPASGLALPAPASGMGVPPQVPEPRPPAAAPRPPAAAPRRAAGEPRRRSPVEEPPLAGHEVHRPATQGDQHRSGGQAGESRPRRPARPAPAPAPAPSASATSASRQETPLYDALLSQIQAREALARAGEAADPTQPGMRRGDGVRGKGPPRDGLPGGTPEGRLATAQIRIVEVLARAGSLVRTTALRIVIVVVAGAAGTVTGINLLAPVFQSDEPGRSLQSSVTRATGNATGNAAVTATGAPAAEVSATAPATAPATGAAPQAFVIAGIQVPSVVTLDDFGRGSITLVASDKAVEWRISAPGLAVKPSSGTLKPGHTDVISVRALRVRYWCGAPAPVTAPLVLHGPKRGSTTTTVRWRTC